MKSRGIGSREISAARMIITARDTEGDPIADMQIGTGVARPTNSRPNRHEDV
jgi:hypothetical protein